LKVGVILSIFKIKYSTTEEGSAIFNYPADALNNNTLMKNFSFIDNTAGWHGGGIYLYCYADQQ
jgi:hypothetical protein